MFKIKAKVKTLVGKKDEITKKKKGEIQGKK